MMNARRMPAEWEPQDGVLLCYPHNGNDWPGKYGAIQWALIEYIKKISRFEKVYLVVQDERLKDKVTDQLIKAHVDMKAISYVECRTNRSWMRDAGPIIVQSKGRREALNFHFNGWAKYGNHQLDKAVPRSVADHLDMPLTKVIYEGREITLEGGALEVNGHGTLITSEECLLHPSIQVRNEGLSRKDYEAIFKQYLGINNTIWVKDGIVGDDTHGHIDDLCRFVNRNTIVTVVEKNHEDENFKALQENLNILKSSRLEDGSSPVIVELPMPDPIRFDSVRLPASYANFLIINKAVLVPTFNDSNDRIALNLLAECFPDREVIGISAIDLIWGFGTLHCLSQQIPI